MRCFERPAHLPHGASFKPSRKQRRQARQERLHRWQWAYRRTRAEAAKERYALGFVDDGDGEAKEIRRLMRNARKQERRAAR